MTTAHALDDALSPELEAIATSVSGSAQRTQLFDLPAAWRLDKKTERAAGVVRRPMPPATCRVSTSRDSRVHPGQRELLARRARRLLGELGTGGAPTRLAPVPHDLPGGGVPPPGRRAQRPEVDLSVCDLQDLAIHAPALDPSEHEIAHGNPLELHRSHSARSRSASFCVAPEGSVERRRAPRVWREDACRQRFEENRASARRPAGILAPHQLHVWSGGETGLGG